MHLSVRRMWLGCLLVACGAVAADLLNATLDGFRGGPATLADIRSQWPGVTWENGLTEGRASWMPADSCWSGDCLRVRYPAGAVGPRQGGVQWRARWSNAPDTAWSSYRVRFGKDFDFRRGGKLPGLCGSQCNTGGRRPDGSDGWSARIMWRDSGRAVLYLYWSEQPSTFAVDFVLRDPLGQPLLFRRGVWHQIVSEVSLNTPGRGAGVDTLGLPDGRVRVWLDGWLALDTGGLRLRNRDTMQVDQFFMSTFHGGSDPSWAPLRDVLIDFDAFAVGSGVFPFGTSALGHRPILSASLKGYGVDLLGRRSAPAAWSPRPGMDVPIGHR